MSASHKILRRSALVLALGLAFGVADLHAQSTTGSLTGQVPTGATSVLVQSDSGLSREVPVDGRGRYQINQLPLGTYTVTVKREGSEIAHRSDVTLTVGANTDVSFADVATLDGVKVTADRAAASIDVSSVDSRTVITAEQLAKLPLGRSAEAIAQLAPGVVANSSNGNFVGPTGDALVSFGGSSAAENAYYINGFNTTDPLRGLGGLTLPYGAIDQQEVYTGGYSAKYGRSDGGVISAVGKRGTNEWHYGAQFIWQPPGTRSSAADVYYPATGELYEPKSKNSTWVTTKSVYAGGPLIQDRLFFFGAYQLEQQEGTTVDDVEATNSYTDYSYERPSWYAKLDWNINDSNLLEITGASSKRKTRGKIYDYDYDTLTRGDFKGYDSIKKTGGDLWVAKYTSYLTDRLTFSALYGKMRTSDYIGTQGYNSALTYISGASYQNPAITGGTPITNSQTVSTLYDPGRGNRTSNLRLDLNYVIGNHSITIGIDNQDAEAVNQGYTTSGPGYYWVYGLSDPDTAINSGLGVPATGSYANGEDGYYVRKVVYSKLANVHSSQRAQYIEDNWQVTDRLLLSLGLRLDQFTNYNSAGQVYINQSSGQWAPRLGFSWDVNGDSRFKVFGNVGRYYLALPLNPALNAAGATLSTSTYYTYSGIDANGEPTGLTQISDAVSANNNYGILPDPKTVTAQGLKPSYQDEAILGFSKAWGADWVYGAKATYRVLRSGVDDYCDIDTVFAKAAALGYTVTSDSNPVSCWLINPGKSNTFTLVDTSGNYVSVPLSASELGLPEYKRKYYALDLSLEHPFDGKWYASFNYTFSRSYGTTEGQLLSTIGQTAVSTTVDWDYASLMEYTNGVQNNDHTHQIKLFGYYQFNSRWLASANISLVSGAPKNCLSYYGSDNSDPSGYGPYYHFCNGEPSPPGSQGRLPWVKQLDLGVSYRPDFGKGRLKFGLDVFNVFNSQTVTWIWPYQQTDPGVADPLYGAAVVRQAPRYLRLNVSYDY
ncbi:MAG: TonB-dependent receptor [Pseudomonas sp.]